MLRVLFRGSVLTACALVVGLLTPVGLASAVTMVVDSTSDRFEASGDWGTSSWNSTKYGDSYRFTTPNTTSSDAAWYRFDVPSTGSYAVDVWYPDDPGYNNETPYMVKTTGGLVSVTVDQRTNGGQWVRLGVFDIAAGDEYVVGVSRWTSGTGYVIADAVRITSSGGTGGFSASATIGGYPVWAHFSNPAPGGQDFTIIDEVNRLIDATPAGATIRAAIHSLNIDSVSQSLVDAENRGVNVWVVIDGKNTNSSDTAVTLIKQLEHHQFCNYSSTGGRACISTSGDGDMHTKMFTFTETTDPDGVAHSDVAWFSSANISHYSGSGARNNAITVYGDAALTAGLNANFNDMWNRHHYSGNDYYDSASGRGYYRTDAATVYASPEGKNQVDTIVSRLNDLVPDDDCVLRISMAFVTGGRPRLVDLMERFEAGGCDVTMAVGTQSDGDIAMSSGPYGDLLASGVRIRRAEQVHDKFFIAYGKYGDVYRYRVYTGSQNWSQDALNENDEIFVKMAPEPPGDHPLYDAYETHWRSAWDTGVTCTTANYPCR